MTPQARTTRRYTWLVWGLLTVPALLLYVWAMIG